MNQEWLEHQVLPDEVREDRGRYWLNLAKLSACVACLLYLLGLALPAQAKPRLTASEGNAVITLFDDKCELKEVSNLPYKALWVADGKTFVGCWGVRPDTRQVVFYFDDGSVGIIPFDQLKQVVGA